MPELRGKLKKRSLGLVQRSQLGLKLASGALSTKSERNLRLIEYSSQRDQQSGGRKRELASHKLLKEAKDSGTSEENPKPFFYIFCVTHKILVFDLFKF